jgi:hypothetical protein
MAPKKAQSQSDRIVAALTASRSPLRTQGLSAFVDFVLDQPIATWIEVDDVVSIATEAATGPNAALYVERHLRPGWERYLARCKQSGDTLGEALPTDVRARIVRLATTTPPPKGEWARDAVDPKLVRDLLSPVLQDFLVSFARKLPLPGIAAGGDGGSRSGFGLRSRLKETVEKRAGAFVEAGRTVLGGLGAEFERQIVTVARDFSDSAGAELRSALKRRVESPEGRRLLSAIITQAIDHTLATPLAHLNEDTAALPWEEIWALIPPVVEHNRGRGPVVEALEDELRAYIDVEGDRTLRALLEEAGTLDITVSRALEQGDAVAKSLFATPQFAAWIDALLEV